MSEASERVLSTFQRSCDEYAKLFIPEPRQDEIINSLTNYYSKYYSLDLLSECIVDFIKTSPDPIIVYNFALESSKIRDKMIERRKSEENFNKLVKETEERMRSFDEL